MTPERTEAIEARVRNYIAVGDADHVTGRAPRCVQDILDLLTEVKRLARAEELLRRASGHLGSYPSSNALVADIDAFLGEKNA